MTFASSPLIERRTWPRRRRRLRALVVPLLPDSDEPLHAWVLDWSPGGLRLAVNLPIKDGVTLSVKLASAPARTPWLEVEVKNGRRQGERFELGCRFVAVPSVMTLLMFG